MSDTTTIEFKCEEGYMYSYKLAEAIIKHFVDKNDIEIADTLAELDELSDHIKAFVKAQVKMSEARGCKV